MKRLGSIAKFNPDTNSIDYRDFKNILKNYMSTKDIAAVQDLFGYFSYLKIESIDNLNYDLKSLLMSKSRKGTLSFIKHKIDNEKWDICNVVNHEFNHEEFLKNTDNIDPFY